MERLILRLIRDEIKITKLLNTLEDLNIDAKVYHIGNVATIQYLLEIPESESFVEYYHGLIESANVETVNSQEKMSSLAEIILEKLRKFNSKEEAFISRENSVLIREIGGSSSYPWKFT